jgi:hypothetical protein
MQMLDENIGKTLPDGTPIGWFSSRGKLYFGVLKLNKRFGAKVEANIDGQKSSHRLFTWEKYFIATEDNAMLAILEKP